ncbi:MAG TPA: hypothetical protein VGI60_02765 [Chthoniobacterales bacterium]
MSAPNTQVSDVKRTILARDPASIVIPHHPPSFSIGKLRVSSAGGSAGGAHALYCAITNIPTRDRLDCARALTTGLPLYSLTQMSPLPLSPFLPLFLFATDNDPIPPYRIDDLKSVLDQLRMQNYCAIAFTDSS